MALKQFSRHQVVWHALDQTIVIIVVMLEYGVIASIVQVSAIVILKCVNNDDYCGIFTSENLNVSIHNSMVIMSKFS